MRIQKKNRFTKKKLIITTAVILSLILGLVGYFLLSANQSAEKPESNQKRHSSNQTSSSSENPTSSTSQADSAANAPVSREEEKEISLPYEGESVNEAQSLSGAITYNGVSGDNLVIRTSINQYLSTGTCALSITNGSRTITRTSNIIANPSSSACEGFDIPTSEVGSGSWDISVTLSSGDRSGTLTGKVSI